MSGARTVFAIIPAAAAARPALAALSALPNAGDARLVGIHVAPMALNYGLIADLALASFIEAQVEAARTEREAARTAFEAACEAAGVRFEWRTGQALDLVVSPQAGSMCRAADLVLCPRLPDEASLGRHRIEEVAFASGRPVIGLPPEWKGLRLGKRVLIAWDGGREGARAAFDALPLLRQAEAVRLVSVNGFRQEPVLQFTPGDDMAATLSRHGVRVEAHSFESTRRSVADELRAQMLDFDGDLLVMGCYGHSRFRERILGGVSKEMLREIAFPLLLAN